MYPVPRNCCRAYRRMPQAKFFTCNSQPTHVSSFSSCSNRGQSVSLKILQVRAERPPWSHAESSHDFHECTILVDWSTNPTHDKCHLHYANLILVYKALLKVYLRKWKGFLPVDVGLRASTCGAPSASCGAECIKSNHRFDCGNVRKEDSLTKPETEGTNKLGSP